MLGLAVGDALGAIVELKTPGEFEPVTEMRQSETWSIPVGAYTDDTSQALCLSQSLIESGFNTSDQLQRYVNWWQDGYMSSTGACFDIGNGTRSALSHWMEHGYNDGQIPSPNSAGAGSIMRLAPLAIWAAHREELGFMARMSAGTTHGGREAVDAAWYFAEIMRIALLESDAADAAELKERVLQPDLETLDEGRFLLEFDPVLLPIAAGEYRTKSASDFHDNGYVVTCLESALWALSTTDNFADGMLTAVNLGRDADTRAAVYGQLAGAIYGVEAIPQDWIADLVHSELIGSIANKLMESPVRREYFDPDPDFEIVEF